MDARLNVTYNGFNGDMMAPFDAADRDLIAMVRESLESADGAIPGIPPQTNVDLDDFVVERFPAEGDLPARIFVRSKTPFGG